MLDPHCQYATSWAADLPTHPHSRQPAAQVSSVGPRVVFAQRVAGVSMSASGLYGPVHACVDVCVDRRMRAS